MNPASFTGARRLLAVAIGASVLIAMGLAADLWLRGSHQQVDAGIWMQTLSLSSPALQGAGTPGRHPEMVHPAVDLRFAAGLEQMP
jgi:hypothetical protein